MSLFVSKYGALYSHLRHLALYVVGQVALMCLHKTGWETSVLRPSTYPCSVLLGEVVSAAGTDRRKRPVPTEDRSPELLLHELGRINSELALQRRESAMTAHDLSSPAQVILGLSEVLLEHQNLDPLVRRRIEQVHRSAVTMSALISDLSSGLALDDRANLETRRLSFGELVTSVVERTRLPRRGQGHGRAVRPAVGWTGLLGRGRLGEARAGPGRTCWATRSSSPRRGRWSR